MTTASGFGETILVTGGSGYVAAHILNSFLDRGYYVKTSVRSQSSADKVKKSHGHYGAQLSFVIVPDITTTGAFDQAVKGVDGVIHTASPFCVTPKDNFRDLLDPAIKGTTSLLESIQKHNIKVKRVVITSSIGAVTDPFLGNSRKYTYTENDWNPVTLEQASFTENGGLVYVASKTLAEQAAWEFVKRNSPKFSITTINPTLIYGPTANYITSLDELAYSPWHIWSLLNGSTKELHEDHYLSFVDVRDVGESHALAYEKSAAANQRYLCVSDYASFQEIVDILRDFYPSRQDLIPKGSPGSRSKTFDVSTEKIKKDLGITFRGLRATIKDMADKLIEIEGKECQT